MMQPGELKVTTTKINGLLVLDINVFPDERGAFAEAWQKPKMAALGLPQITPMQMSVSHSKKGVIRGVHAEPWEKYIHIAHGKVFAAISDLRPDSATFGVVETFELDQHKALFLPKGMGNSFQALTDEVAYVYLVTGEWSRELADKKQYLAVVYNDPDLAIDWPIKGEAQIVSDKDQAAPTLREVFPEKF